MDPESILVIHGFLALPNREKMKVVEAMNEYFDSTEKEKIRATYDEHFASLRIIENNVACKCCGRKCLCRQL